MPSAETSDSYRDIVDDPERSEEYDEMAAEIATRAVNPGQGQLSESLQDHAGENAGFGRPEDDPHKNHDHTPDY